MKYPCVLFLVLVTLAFLLPSAHPQDPKKPDPPQTAEAVVRELYTRVSFKAGETTDWGAVRALFRKDAVIVLRTSRTATSAFTLEGFIQDFIKFDTLPAVKAAGFSERVVRLKATAYGDIAHVLVLYEAAITGDTRPPQQGIDSFHLVRKDSKWLIVSVINEIVTPGNPLPPELREEKGGG